MANYIDKYKIKDEGLQLEGSKPEKAIEFYKSVLQIEPIIYCEDRWVEFQCGNKIALYNKKFDEKKIRENIQYLKELNNSLKDSIKEIKSIFEKINENKEEIKKKIQNVFTKLRTELNKY